MREIVLTSLLLGSLTHGSDVLKLTEEQETVILKESKYQIQIRDSYFRSCRKQSATGDAHKIELTYDCNGAIIYVVRQYVNTEREVQRAPKAR